MRDDAYEEQNMDDKNILRWAALMHDISKRGKPEITGRDHIHPFVSGGTTLETFKHMQILKVNEEDEEKFTNLLKLIEESVRKLEGAELVAQLKRTRWQAKNICYEVQSHHLLDQIFDIFWSLTPRGGFVDLVFRLVLFH